jgi:hypothetical protein
VLRWVDEFDGGIGWLIEDEFRRRCSHALVVGEDVWLIDPLDRPGVGERLRELGRPRGVIQLLDRHDRDCAALAARLGVPLYERPATVRGAPFAFATVLDVPRWREVALWWEERRTLVVADALGTLGYFVTPEEPIGVHPLLRLWPPRALARYEPARILCGHGAGVHTGAADALESALRTARRRLPRAWLGVLRRR